MYYIYALNINNSLYMYGTLDIDLLKMSTCVFRYFNLQRVHQKKFTGNTNFQRDKPSSACEIQRWF